MRVVVLALCASLCVFTHHCEAQEVSAYDAVATWYSLPGKNTATGNVFKPKDVVIAARNGEIHPLGACVRLVNLDNRKSIEGPITDRMPKHSNRYVFLRVPKQVEKKTKSGTKFVVEMAVVKTIATFDLSPGAVQALGLDPLRGVFRIRVETCTTAAKKVARAPSGEPFIFTLTAVC